MNGSNEIEVLEPLRTAHSPAGPLYVLTAAEMRGVDKRAMGSYGIATDQLMESAGAGAARLLDELQGDLFGYRVAILCGKGHNGGDGLVIARHLARSGVKVQVSVLASPGDLKGVVASNARRLAAVGVEPIARLQNGEIKSWLGETRWDVVVDALLGTGSEGELRGLYAEAAEAIEQARRSGSYVVAVDLPTGVDADTGERGTSSVRADLTATFAYPKRGHVLYPGRAQCGRVEVIDIGIPAAAAEEEGCRVELCTPQLATELLPHRPETAHKGTVGKGLVIGGSPGLTGAVAMTAEASLRVGMGMVFTAVPESLHAILEAKMTEPITIPVTEDEQGVSPDALPVLLDQIGRVAAVAVGPGLGLGARAPQLLSELLAQAGIPLVVDADGLTALSVLPQWHHKVGGPVALTPHVGEMSRLTGLSMEEIERRRIDVALEWAEKWEVVVVLKGAPTIIAAPDGRATVNSSGNPGMASAGMGDVLTGCVLSLLAQGLSVYDAARLGAYVHGRAADRICTRRGVALCLATEVAAELTATIGEIRGRSGAPVLPPPLPSTRRELEDIEPPPEPHN